MNLPDRKEILTSYSRYGIPAFDWIVPGKVMASVFPDGEEYLRYLHDAEGIGLAINLSESPWPPEWSRSTGVMSIHIPVEDFTAPTVEQALTAVKAIASHDGPVMVHCAAGLGRTGTVIAIYLMETGMGWREAVRWVREKREGSIQSSDQKWLVEHWTKLRGETL